MKKKSMKTALAGLCLAVSYSIFAQTGNVSMNLSGALSSNPAILDLSDASNAHLGFLMPNVSLQSATDNTTIPGPITGMIVWNTNNSMPFGVGYYYWSGSAWLYIDNSGNAIVTADNGITINAGNDVELGGNLTKNTTITNNGNALTFAGSSINTTIVSTGQVGIGTASPSASAALVVASTTQGVLLPSLNSTQAATLAASNPAAGLIIYNTTINCYEFFANGGWQQLACACSTAPTSVSILGTTTPRYNSTTTYSAVATGATSYTWSSSNTNVAYISAGQGSPVVTVATTDTTGTFTLTLVSGNTCGSTSATLFITPFGTIEEDATGASGEQSQTFTITTTHANDLVLVSCNAYSNIGPWNGAVYVNGGGNPTATLFQAYASPNNHALIAVYYFVAPTAATYAISVGEGSNVFNSGNNYANFGVALTGFSGTPSGADLVSYNEAENSTGSTTLSATLTESAGSYAFGTVSNSWVNPTNNPYWTGITTLGFISYIPDDFGIGGIAVSAAGTPTITANDLGGFNEGIIMLIDVR